MHAVDSSSTDPSAQAPINKAAEHFAPASSPTESQTGVGATDTTMVTPEQPDLDGPAPVVPASAHDAALGAAIFAQGLADATHELFPDSAPVQSADRAVSSDPPAPVQSSAPAAPPVQPAPVQHHASTATPLPASAPTDSLAFLGAPLSPFVSPGDAQAIAISAALSYLASAAGTSPAATAASLTANVTPQPLLLAPVTPTAANSPIVLTGTPTPAMALMASAPGTAPQLSLSASPGVASVASHPARPGTFPAVPIPLTDNELEEFFRLPPEPTASSRHAPRGTTRPRSRLSVTTIDDSDEASDDDAPIVRPRKRTRLSEREQLRRTVAIQQQSLNEMRQQISQLVALQTTPQASPEVLPIFGASPVPHDFVPAVSPAPRTVMPPEYLCNVDLPDFSKIQPCISSNVSVEQVTRVAGSIKTQSFSASTANECWEYVQWLHRQQFLYAQLDGSILMNHFTSAWVAGSPASIWLYSLERGDFAPLASFNNLIQGIREHFSEYFTTECRMEIMRSLRCADCTPSGVSTHYTKFTAIRVDLGLSDDITHRGMFIDSILFFDEFDDVDQYECRQADTFPVLITRIVKATKVLVYKRSTMRYSSAANRVDHLKDRTRAAPRPNASRQPTRAAPAMNKYCHFHGANTSHSTWTDNSRTTIDCRGNGLHGALRQQFEACLAATKAAKDNRMPNNFRVNYEAAVADGSWDPKAKRHVALKRYVDVAAFCMPDLHHMSGSDINCHTASCPPSSDLPATLPGSETSTIPSFSSDVLPVVFRCNINEAFSSTFLFDTGAEVNLLSAELSDRLSLPLQTAVNFRVGRALNGHRFVLDTMATVQFQCGTYLKSIDLYVTPLPNHQIILGVPFMEHVQVNVDWPHKFDVTDKETNTVHDWHSQRVNTDSCITKDNVQACALGLSHTKVPLQQYNPFGFPDSAIAINNVAFVSAEDYIAQVDDFVHQELLTVAHCPAETQFSSDVDVCVFNHDELEPLLAKYKDVFTKHSLSTWMPSSNIRPMDIHFVPDAKLPAPRPIGRHSASELEAIRLTITELLEAGIIRPSTSHLASGLLLAKKKDGTYRMCVDYRAINKITIKDRSPLPIMSQYRDLLARSKIFSKLDLSDAFHHIPIAEKDIYKTAFNSHLGHFEYVFMPFGLCNAPGVFQSAMNQIFGDIIGKVVIIYIDDFLIMSANEDEHLAHIELVFDRLQANGLHAKMSKCMFGVRELEYCGHLVTTKGVSILPSYKESISALPLIEDKSDLQSYLGAVAWIQDWLKDYAKIAAPLTDLLRKESNLKKEWRDEVHGMALRQIKDLIDNASLLAFYDPDLPTNIHTDASDYAIGGFLEQKHSDGKWRPVVFWSRKLQSAEIRYPVREREFLALHDFVRRHRHMVSSGNEVTCNTDHQSLIWLHQQNPLSPRLSRQVMELEQYNIVIKYVKGETNSLADFLSRASRYKPRCATCHSEIEMATCTTTTTSCDVCVITTITSNIPQQARAFYEKDETAQLFNKHLLNPASIGKHHQWLRHVSLRDRIWFYKSRVYIPADSLDNRCPLRLQLLEAYHDTPMSGHRSIAVTQQQLARFYYWPSMFADVEAFVKSCHSCQLVKADNHAPYGMAHPLEIPSDRFRDIAVDFFFLSKSSNDNDMVMLVVDRLTKLIAAVPCKKTATAADIVRLLFDHWVFRGHGLPTSIVSDRDSKFTSDLWIEICKRVGIRQCMSTASHQQTDGQAERSVRTIKEALRHYANFQQSNWEDHLQAVVFAANSAKQASTKHSAFFLAYGTMPSALPTELSVNSDCAPAKNLLVQISAALSDSTSHLAKASARAAVYYDKHRTNAPPFKLGQQVLISRNALTLPTDAQRPEALLPKFHGPFTVTNVDSQTDNITVKLPGNLRNTHPVFHASYVRPYTPQDTFFNDRSAYVEPEPDCIDDDGHKQWLIDHVVSHQTTRRGRRFLVRWEGYSSSYDSYVSETNMRHTAPDALNDYLVSKGLTN
jgi:hypothetical protein